MDRNGRARPPDACGRGNRRLVVAAALHTRPARVVADAAPSQAPWAERQLDSAAPRALRPAARARALATASVVAARVVVVIAEPEEPDQPDDEQAHVEHAETDHEDPPLGGHWGDASAMGQPVEEGFAYSASSFVTRLLGTYVTE
jgi:hypothetical protein